MGDGSIVVVFDWMDDLSGLRFTSLWFFFNIQSRSSLIGCGKCDEMIKESIILKDREMNMKKYIF